MEARVTARTRRWLCRLFLAQKESNEKANTDQERSQEDDHEEGDDQNDTGVFHAERFQQSGLIERIDIHGDGDRTGQISGIGDSDMNQMQTQLRWDRT